MNGWELIPCQLPLEDRETNNRKDLEMAFRLVILVMAGAVWLAGFGPALASGGGVALPEGIEAATGESNIGGGGDGGGGHIPRGNADKNPLLLNSNQVDKSETIISPEVSGQAAATGKRNTILGPANNKPVYVLKLDGTVELGLSAFIDRALGEATRQGGAAFIIQMNTLGGRLDAAIKIRDTLLNSTIPTITYIDKRAISAGALIALATDVIAVTEGATMGAATPVQSTGQDQKVEAADEKIISYMRKEMRSTAEAKNRSGDLAEAMVDKDVEVEGVVEKGKLLTVTTEEGLKLGLFDLQAASLDQLLTQLGLDDGQVVNVEQNWAEDVARFLTDPVVASLLMTIGFLGLIMELYTAGFGITGVIGILSLLLFFFGHAVVNLAGMEELLIFVVGVGLLLVEAFVIPGFGVVGVLGILCILASLVLTLIGLPIAISWSTGDLGRALSSVAIALGITIIVGALLFRFLPRARPLRRLILTARVGGADGDSYGHGRSCGRSGRIEAECHEHQEHQRQPAQPGDVTLLADKPPASMGTEHIDEATLVSGTRGLAVTSLHPWGKVQFEGRGRIEATTWDGSWIEPGSLVEVVRIQGAHVLVRLVQSDE